MAIAYSNASTGATTSGGASSLTYSHTTATLSNGVLLVAFGYYNRTLSASSVTYNGVALTKRRRYDNGSAQATSEIWFLVNPPSGTFNVVITMSGSVGITSCAMTLSGVDQTTPIEADNGGTVVTGTHTAHSGSVTTVTADAWVVDHMLGVSTLSTSVGGQTERAEVTISGGSDTLAIATRGPIATPASSSAGWTFASTGIATNQIICAVKPASGGTGGAYYYRRRRSTTTGGRGL